MILSEQPFSSKNIPPGSSSSDALAIRTPFPKDLIPPRATPRVKERLRQLARENMSFSGQQPHRLEISAGIIERVLPGVSGTLRIRGIDEDPKNGSYECIVTQDNMLWDTGANSCTITEDVLPRWFLDYLAKDEHNPHRDASGTKVQIDGYLSLTNSKFFFNCIFTVCPASTIPNSRNGVTLGQSGFLNCMLWTAIPRAILEHRGEKVKDNEWGDIHISDWIDPCGEVCQF